MRAIEKSTSSTFVYNITNRWVGIRLDVIVVIFGIFTALSTVLLKGKVSNEILVFSLNIVSDSIIFFSISVRMYAEVQNMMTSVQRMLQYTELE